MMGKVRKTVGVYERPDKRGDGLRTAALVVLVAVAAVAAVVAVYLY